MKSTFDPVLVDIVDYCYADIAFSKATLREAACALMDSMGCAMLALQNSTCRQHIQPLFNSQHNANGVPVAGTHFQLDPIQASYTLSAMTRWLDYNDTWLAEEWGHPSDNIAAILCCAYYSSRRQNTTIAMHQILDSIIRAYEIQGVLALKNSFNRRGFDHVILVKIATTAIVVKLLGCNQQQCLNALSNAVLDGAALRSYRQQPNTGWRKSWAAADASARGVYHALHACRGEMGYATAISAETWGFNQVILNGDGIQRQQDYHCYVIDNILYKVSFPVEFHAQTAVECALQLHQFTQQDPAHNINDVDCIRIFTQQAAMRIINKTGPLNNPADRDHCIQYAVAVALLTGELTTENFSDQFASNSDIDGLRDKILIQEDPQYTLAYHDPKKRAIANRVEIRFTDGSTESRECLYPLGHGQRRAESLPQLIAKFKSNLSELFSSHEIQQFLDLFSHPDRMMNILVTDWLEHWIR